MECMTLRAQETESHVTTKRTALKERRWREVEGGGGGGGVGGGRWWRRWRRRVQESFVLLKAADLLRGSKRPMLALANSA